MRPISHTSANPAGSGELSIRVPVPRAMVIVPAQNPKPTARGGARPFVLAPRRKVTGLNCSLLCGGSLRGAAKPPAQSRDSREAHTGAKKQERCRLRRSCIRRRDVGRERRSVEEEVGGVAELVEAAVVQIAEGEQCVDLLVGAQTTEGVEQGERDVIRARADVVGVVQRASENVAEETSERR